jgi:hypothetical protein
VSSRNFAWQTLLWSDSDQRHRNLRCIAVLMDLGTKMGEFLYHHWQKGKFIEGKGRNCGNKLLGTRTTIFSEFDQAHPEVEDLRTATPVSVTLDRLGFLG